LDYTLTHKIEWHFAHYYLKPKLAEVSFLLLIKTFVLSFINAAYNLIINKLYCL
jgi:hypothetical protein